MVIRNLWSTAKMLDARLNLGNIESFISKIGLYKVINRGCI